MSTSTDSQRPWAAICSLTCAAAVWAGGCLYQGDPGDIEPTSTLGSLEGVQVELIRRSSQCSPEAPKGAIVEVGPGLEYPADLVESLDSRCARFPNPAVEVHVEPRSVLFDFSSVSEPSRFPTGGFEGYVLRIVPTEASPLLSFAAIDEGSSTMPMDEGHLGFDEAGLEVDFQGVDFDSMGFLKIDLYLTKRRSVPSNDSGP